MKRKSKREENKNKKFHKNYIELKNKLKRMNKDKLQISKEQNKIQILNKYRI